jgi:hypothetical protein
MRGYGTRFDGNRSVGGDAGGGCSPAAWIMRDVRPTGAPQLCFGSIWEYNDSQDFRRGLPDGKQAIGIS